MHFERENVGSIIGRNIIQIAESQVSGAMFDICVCEGVHIFSYKLKRDNNCCYRCDLLRAQNTIKQYGENILIVFERFEKHVAFFKITDKVKSVTLTKNCCFDKKINGHNRHVV